MLDGSTSVWQEEAPYETLSLKAHAGSDAARRLGMCRGGRGAGAWLLKVVKDAASPDCCCGACKRPQYTCL